MYSGKCKNCDYSWDNWYCVVHYCHKCGKPTNIFAALYQLIGMIVVGGAAVLLIGAGLLFLLSEVFGWIF